MVTVPVLAVLPASIVSVLVAERVKSPATAPVPAAADTVRTTSRSLFPPLSVAVTVDELVAPLSLMEAGSSVSATVGVASSSVTSTSTSSASSPA